MGYLMWLLVFVLLTSERLMVDLVDEVMECVLGDDCCKPVSH